MKITFTKNLCLLAGCAIAALTGPMAMALPVPASPVGQWDCVISGSGQTGIMFLNFTDDTDTNSGFPTFEGFYIQAGHAALAQSSSGRGTTSSGRGNGSSSSVTNLFGGGFIEGSAGGVANNGGPGDWLLDSRGHRGNWFYNSKGQVVGSFFTTLNASSIVTNYFETCVSTNVSISLTNGGTYTFPYDVCFTNAVLSTNVFWGPAADNEFGFTNLSFVNTNFTIGAIGTTNSVSFVGKVVLGKRITLSGTSSYGKITITGVPLLPITIKSGVPVDGPYFWTGTTAQNGVKKAEVFHLTPTGIQNLYGMTGQGPSYSYNLTNSFCMISASKKIGFAVSEIPFLSERSTLHLSRATVGKFTNTGKKIGANTVGDDVDDIDLLSFDASLTPFIP